MAIARKHLVDDATPGCYHLISRCVRRGFLCGVAYAHRRDWVRNLVEGAARCFAVDVLTYAVMDNHCHLVVRTDPARVDNWSDREVAERWATAHPRRAFTAEPVAWEESEIACCAADPLWIARHRARLASLSWFMKAIKEPIAKRANREDGCTGHFWEGRFKSVRLLDQQAVVACMAYVDLNPRSAAARRRRLARSHDVGGRHDRRRHRQPRRARRRGRQTRHPLDRRHRRRALPTTRYRVAAPMVRRSSGTTCRSDGAAWSHAIAEPLNHRRSTPIRRNPARWAGLVGFVGGGGRAARSLGRSRACLRFPVSSNSCWGGR